MLKETAINYSYNFYAPLKNIENDPEENTTCSIVVTGK